jgi:hypothetical protein
LKSIYKLYISYLINLFSKYLQNNEFDLLKKILSFLKEDQNFIQDSITRDFKRICFKKVTFILLLFIFKYCLLQIAVLMANQPNSSEFRELLNNQDLIYNFESYSHYSDQHLIDEVCCVLKKSNYLDDKSLFKTVNRI